MYPPSPVQVRRIAGVLALISLIALAPSLLFAIDALGELGDHAIVPISAGERAYHTSKIVLCAWGIVHIPLYLSRAFNRSRVLEARWLWTSALLRRLCVIALIAGGIVAYGETRPDFGWTPEVNFFFAFIIAGWSLTFGALELVARQQDHAV